jgi:hypothetical protein
MNSIRLNALLIFLSAALHAHSQNTVIRYYDRSGNEATRDEANNFTISYKINDTCWGLDYYWQNGPLRRSEQYRDKENKIKNGQFALYSVLGLIDSAGRFSKGQQDGDWIIYRDIGSASLKEIYRNGILIQSTDIASLAHSSDSSGFVPSVFPGGARAWQSYLLGHLRMPDEIIRDYSGLDVNIIVGFTVETDGSLTDIRMVKSRFYLLDEYAINFIKWEQETQPSPVGVSGRNATCHSF